MSRLAPVRSRPSRKPQRFSIVASRVNERYVQGLVDHATAELKRLVPGAVISLHRVPGAFEIPILTRELASREKPDGVLALGVILQGETSHAENLASSVTGALQQIAISYGIPVINAVLSLKTEKQARERCLGTKINRGTEAAHAAVEIVASLRSLQSRAG